MLLLQGLYIIVWLMNLQEKNDVLCDTGIKKNWKKIIKKTGSWWMMKDITIWV